MAHYLNLIKLTAINLIAAATAIAQDTRVEIEARYDGFPPALFASLDTDATKIASDGVLQLPKFTTRAGRKASMAVGKETILPVSSDGGAPAGPRTPPTVTATNLHGETTVDGRKTAFSGVTLEVLAEIRDGQISLSGTSTIRQPLVSTGAIQSSNAVNFSTRETVFSDKVVDGKPMVVRAGDAPGDQSRITLTVRIVASK